MTPKCKTSNSTTLIIERQTLEPPTVNGNDNGNVHIAGGDHKGIVINKQAVAGIKILKMSLRARAQSWRSIGTWHITKNNILNFYSNKRRGMSCPALPTVQGVPGECSNWEAHSGTKDSAILVYGYAPWNGTTKHCARILQRTCYSAGVS